MRICPEYLENKTHSIRSRQAAAPIPHTHTLRQVGDFIRKESMDPGRTILHNILINVFITRGVCRYI